MKNKENKIIFKKAQFKLWKLHDVTIKNSSTDKDTFKYYRQFDLQI